MRKVGLSFNAGSGIYMVGVGSIAQRLEQGTHNPLVPGSNPGGPTIFHISRPGLGEIHSLVVGRFAKRINDFGGRGASLCVLSIHVVTDCFTTLFRTYFDGLGSRKCRKSSSG